jgi:hypothetical protein
MQRLARPSFIVAATLLAAVAACSGGSSTPDGAPSNPSNNNNNPKPGDAGPGNKGNPPSTGGEDGGVPASGPSNGSGTGGGGPELFLWREKVYGGFDGTHPFLIPTAIVLLKDDGTDFAPAPFATPPTFTLSDPSVATVKIVPAPTNPEIQNDPFLKASTFALITPTKGGQAVLTVTYEAQSVKAGIQINAYTADQYTLGQTRYTTPANPSATRVACVTCHAVNSDAGVNAPRHDPFLQQDLSDEQLLVIIEQGLYEANNPNSALNAPGGHKWSLTPEEQKALPAYLRSLKPLGF